MSKKRIDENVMKYIIKLFFPSLERDIVNDPAIQRELREVSKIAADFNEKLERLEQLTGKDLSNLYFKRK
jgi:archaellum component FlaC